MEILIDFIVILLNIPIFRLMFKLFFRKNEQPIRNTSRTKAKNPSNPYILLSQRNLAQRLLGDEKTPLFLFSCIILIITEYQLSYWIAQMFR